MLKYLTLTAALLYSTTASAGVPVLDFGKMTNHLQVLLNQEKDKDTQVEKAKKRAEQHRISEEQLATLDILVDKFSTISTIGADMDAGTMRVDGKTVPSSIAVYGDGKEDPNPAGVQMFGDASLDIERLIIRVAKDTVGLSGVRSAGLSVVQWRCLLQALIKQESRFQVGARSPKAAYGLTQIIPGTAKGLGIYPEYYNSPYLQVKGGARYLSKMLGMFNGNIIHALAGYNAGPGAVQKYGGVPPYKETQNYVIKIPTYYNQYLNNIGGIEATGTINPTLLAAANASLLNAGSIYYGENSYQTIKDAMLRLRALIVKINQTKTAKEAMDLNSYLKIEITKILAARIRLKASKTKAMTAEQLAQFKARQQELKFMDFTMKKL
ncbi:MAG: transglycosylase SLT domain-containing protein [Rhizobiales bacterium]|nr:transglycosylase SLT domain-containing protein [Hyphomicrobiales bacterium]